MLRRRIEKYVRLKADRTEVRNRSTLGDAHEPHATVSTPKPLERCLSICCVPSRVIPSCCSIPLSIWPRCRKCGTAVAEPRVPVELRHAACALRANSRSCATVSESEAAFPGGGLETPSSRRWAPSAMCPLPQLARRASLSVARAARDGQFFGLSCWSTVLRSAASARQKLGNNLGTVAPKQQGKRGGTGRPESKTSQQHKFPCLICKTSIPGSNPGGASKSFLRRSRFRGSRGRLPHLLWFPSVPEIPAADDGVDG